MNTAILRKGGMSRTTAYREMLQAETNATSPPSCSPKELDIDYFHCSYEHVHESLLQKTAEQLGVILQK